jgi:hypothetical protein
MMNSFFLFSAGLRLALVFLTCGALLLPAPAAGRPNVVLILVDDLGYMDIGTNNPKSSYPTPNIDRLARSEI